MSRLGAGFGAVIGLCAIVGSTFSLPEVWAGELLVAGASSLREPFKEVAENFAVASGVGVRTYFEGSGVIARQIEQGAPVDIFACASPEWGERLKKEEHPSLGTSIAFARNRLVVISGKGRTSPVDLSELVSDTSAPLAIGNPRTVPAGRYAKQVFEGRGVWKKVRDRIIPGGNVRQVLEYVSRGEVSSGFVYATDAAMAGPRVTVAFRIPEEWHSPIIYTAVVPSGSARKNEAFRFLEFLVGPTAQSVLKRHGFLGRGEGG